MLLFRTDCVLRQHKLSFSRIWPPVWPLQAKMKDKSISFSFSTLSWYRLMLLHSEVETRTLRCKDARAHGQLITEGLKVRGGKIWKSSRTSAGVGETREGKTSHCKARGRTGQTHTHKHSQTHTQPTLHNAMGHPPDPVRSKAPSNCHMLPVHFLFLSDTIQMAPFIH